MNRRRVRIAAFALIMTVSLIFGCRQKTNITIGTDASFRPFAYLEGETFRGFDIEIARIIAEEIDTEADFRNMDFEILIPALESGEIDMAVSAIPLGDEREERIDFSPPYFEASPACTTLVGSNQFFSKEDLEGADIGVLAYSEAKKTALELGGTVRRFDRWEEALNALRKREIDCIMADEETSQHYLRLNEDIKILPFTFPLRFYSIAVQKENRKLLDSINTTLAKLKASGEYARLISKHFP
jgi:ABC-type amino acid transport substrate-binding protein